jgi:hypothetical protein
MISMILSKSSCSIPKVPENFGTAFCDIARGALLRDRREQQTGGLDKSITVRLGHGYFL